MKRRFIMRLSVGSIMHDEVVEFDDSPSVILGAKLEDARKKVQKEYGRRAVVESVKELKRDGHFEEVYN